MSTHSVARSGSPSLTPFDRDSAKVPQLPPVLSGLSQENVSVLSTSITVEDIKNATRFNGGGSGDILLSQTAKIAYKRLRLSGNDEQVQQIRTYAFNEAEIWKTLQHDYILPFLQVLEWDGSLYLASPYVSNGSLSDYLQSYSDADRPRLIRETAAAILFLHSREFIHGDIKASNILVSDDVHILLCDFGLTRSIHTATVTGLKGKGSIRWESPELIDNNGRGKTYASDVWAFGMTIYEVLSGQIPFHECRNDNSVLHAIFIRNQRPPKMPTQSEAGISYAAVWRVASGCWQKDPDQRSTMVVAHSQLEEATLRLPVPFQEMPLSVAPATGGMEPFHIVAHQPSGIQRIGQFDAASDSLPTPSNEERERVSVRNSLFKPDSGPVAAGMCSPDLAAAPADEPSASQITIHNARTTRSDVGTMPFLDELPAKPIVTRLDLSHVDDTDFESTPSSPVSNTAPDICPFSFDYVPPYSIKVTGLHKKSPKSKRYTGQLKSSKATVVLERYRSQNDAPSEPDGVFWEADIRHVLRHPNILPFLGIYKTLRHIYIISPYMENQTLVEYLHINPEVNRLSIMLEISAAVKYLHLNRKFIHGDIRASNVLISSSGSAVLGNFRSTVREREAQPLRQAHDDEAVRWQSPEIHVPNTKISFKSDVYAFGMTICEVLGGDIPFYDIPASSDVAEAVIRGERPATQPTYCLATGMPYTPAWTVATACWAHEPASRPTIIIACSLLADAVTISSAFISMVSSKNTKAAIPVAPPTRKGTSKRIGAIENFLSTSMQMMFTPATLLKDLLFDHPIIPGESRTTSSQAFAQSASSIAGTAQQGRPFDFIPPGHIKGIRNVDTLVGGDSGEMYQGKHRTEGRVAMKRLRGLRNLDHADLQLKRTLRAANICMQFDHPSVLRFIGVYKSARDLYLVSPFIANGSVTEYLVREPNADRVRLLMEAASAVVYLHKQGVIHGIIKASNILVSDDIHALLCDFGLSRPAHEAALIGLRGVGIVRWQSPELWAETPRKTFESDVWAFGITAYEVLSGEIPFHVWTNIGAVISAVTRGERPPNTPSRSPTGVSYQMVWEMAADCWNVDPTRRPSIQAVHSRLIMAFETQNRPSTS